MLKFTNSAAYRIAFTYSCVFALAILLLGSIVYLAADAQFRAQQDVGIAEENALLLREYREGGARDLREAIAKREARNGPDGYRYALFNAAGIRAAGSLDTPRPASGRQNIVFRDAREGEDRARALVTDLSDGNRLVVATDLTALERVDATIFMLFAGAFALVVLLGLVGALILGSYLRRRLGRISGTAQAIIAGSIDHRISVSSRNDEFDQLAVALNTMLDRIATLLDNLRQVSSDVAHDLRTPLARMRGQIESALDGDPDPHTHRQALKRALRQSDDLLALFAAILRIAEVESGALTRHFSAVDLSDVTRDLCESYAPAVADRGRTLDCAIDAAALVTGDRELIAQAVINLLDNAQRHTPASTHISVRVSADDKNVAVSVADDGPGVPAVDRARIVRRFTRLDASRTTPGYGLGLNLVSAIAAAHGGSLRFEDNGPGLRALLTLPRLAT